MSELVENLRDRARIAEWTQSTQRTYQSPYNSWGRFSEVSRVDPYCKNREGRVHSKVEIEDSIINYIVIECGVRKLAPDSVIKTYLPGIASTFDLLKEDCAEAFRAAINSK